MPNILKLQYLGSVLTGEVKCNIEVQSHISIVASQKLKKIVPYIHADHATFEGLILKLILRESRHTQYIKLEHVLLVLAPSVD